MADRVDAAMNTPQTPEAQTVIDRAIGESESRELRPGDDPVLPLRQPGNRLVSAMRPAFAVYINANVGPMRHGRRVTSKSARAALRM